MKLFTNILAILLLVCPSTILGQTYFNMRYPPDSNNWGGWASSVVVKNESYNVHRSSLSNIEPFRTYTLTSINERGSGLRNLDSIHYDSLEILHRSLIGVENGFMDVSSIQGYSPNYQSYGIVKYDTNGVLQFHHIDTTKYGYIFMPNVIAIANGNLVSVGSLRESSSNYQKAVLIRSDSLGNEIWKKTYRFNSFDHNGHSVALCKDGGFLIGGAEVNHNVHPFFERPLIIKTDSLGNVQWKRVYGSPDYGNTPAYGVTTTLDGGYAFVGAIGTSTSVTYHETVPWVVKLDSLGNVLWSFEHQNFELTPYPYENFFRDIIELPDSSLVTVGQQRVKYYKDGVLDDYGMRGVLLKLNTSGTKEWVRFYNHPESDPAWSTTHNLFDVKPTSDGGFVAVGTLAPSVDNTQDTWVIKVDSFGCLVKGCELTSVPKIESSIAQVKIYPNPASEVIHFDITPNGNQQNYELTIYDMLGRLVLSLTLQPHENTIDVSQLKSGIYNYRINETWGSIVIE